MSVNVVFETAIIILPEQKRGDIIGMDIFAYLLLQIINGYNWSPKYGESSKFKNWIAILDVKTCLICRNMHGKIWDIDEAVEKEPPVHPRCRCAIKSMVTIKSGTATINKTDGADWRLKHYNKLPDYYITRKEAKNKGWNPKIGNFKRVCPTKMISGGVYYNDNNHLPVKKDRIWYEADINYKVGYRNNQRIVWSNDGLIFVTFDHYKTFFEIV